jgi:hypothetical protein
MGDLSPFGVMDCNDADATEVRGGATFKFPEIADWCVAAVPVGSSDATVSGCVAEGVDSMAGTGDASEEAVGSADFFGSVLEDRRQRLKSPNI